ncbi:MAG: hypothetical protein J3K34DRAFT_425004 [Monoraphidium minutum]|nr:MAG: hypothetical protein J3K34DRAFT_425004 [Monoraphidium minutum]
MAGQLSQEEVRDLKELFDMLDTDKGGTLSVDEVRQLLGMLGVRVGADEARGMVAKIDRDGSGGLDLREFLQMVAAPQPLPFSRADALRAFRQFTNGRDAPPGCISPEALERALLDYGLESGGVEASEVSRMVHRLDTNAAGLIDYREAVALLFSGRHHQPQGQGGGPDRGGGGA